MDSFFSLPCWLLLFFPLWHHGSSCRLTVARYMAPYSCFSPFGSRPRLTLSLGSSWSRWKNMICLLVHMPAGCKLSGRVSGLFGIVWIWKNWTYHRIHLDCKRSYALISTTSPSHSAETQFPPRTNHFVPTQTNKRCASGLLPEILR